MPLPHDPIGWSLIGDYGISLLYLLFLSTVKLVQNGHSKIDKIKVLKTNGSLMKVKSIAE